MHRPGRVGRDVLDIDLLALAEIGAAEVGALRAPTDRSTSCQIGVVEPEIDEARTGDLDRGDVRVGLEMLDERRRHLARILAQRLGDDHRGIGREIAMAGIARRLDHDRATSSSSLGDLGIESALSGSRDPGGEIGERRP